MMKHAGGKRRPFVLAGLLRIFVRPYARQVGLISALQALQAAGNLYLPYLAANIINKGVVDGDVGYIWRAGGLMLAIALLAGLVSVVTVYWASRVALGVGADMRAAVYRRVQAFSAREMNRFGISSLVTRNVYDVKQVQLCLQLTLTLLIMAAVLSVGGAIMAVIEGTGLSLLIVVVVPVMVLVTGATLVAVIPLFRVLQVKVDRINQLLREQITGVRVIRAFGRTRSEEDQFAEANAGLAGTTLRANRIFALAGPGLVLIVSLSSVSVLWFGGRLVSEGSMPVGNLTAFLVYILLTLFAVTIVGPIVSNLPRAAASAERIEQVINAPLAVTDPVRPVTPAKVTGTVEFRHVTFGYPGGERPVVSDLTFTLRPGQTSAIIGGTGGGKTTLLNLIPRFLDVTGGAVLVNGADVREQSAERLLATIGLVPQASFLFRGTVASNLRFGMPDATDEQLWRALDIAQARDFVADLPGQLDALIDRGGTNISGGQRQRLSIARALVRRPRLYLFDDCFSALDAATDARLRGALRAGIQDCTTVIVAQRVSTIMHADQIIVLDAGRIAGIGTHDQLLASCGPYQEIASSQLGEGAASPMSRRPLSLRDIGCAVSPPTSQPRCGSLAS
jgi:ABC-type multidrug transport system fused ATPase/permease subunit